MLKAPQNLFATAYDGSVRSEWQAVDGADGYILQFYNADEPEKCKSRVMHNIFLSRYWGFVTEKNIL